MLEIKTASSLLPNSDKIEIWSSLLHPHPALVAFNKRRFIGINFSTINPKNVVSQIKRFIGLHDCDPQDLRRLPYDITKAANGSLLIHVDYLGESMPFSPTHILGMILGSLKSIAERALEMDVADCVIGIPAFFPEIQRRAVLDAAAIAGLRPLQLMHETTASALVYGINRIDLPENEPIHVVFVDVGHASTQISVVAFKKGQLQVLAHVFDRSLGGRDFDEVLFEHFCKKFKQQYQSNLKACQRLRAKCEELKIGLNRWGRVSYFLGIDGTDASGSMKREEFEKLSQPLLERVSKLSKGALLEANIPPERIYAVEVVGSGSRVPAISKFLSAVFKKEPSKSMNTRECVSQGCTLRCAMLSSATFRGRPEFEVQDVLPFSISLAWEGSGPDPEGGVPPTGDQSCSIIFPEGNPIPSTKMLTFYRSGTFTLGAVYTDMHNLPLGTHQKINAFTIGPFQTKRAETAKINVKVHLDLHGIVSIASAIMIEEEKVEFIPTSEEVVGGMTQADLQRAIGKEYEMAMHDLAMKEAEDSKNALEKYAYEMLSQMYERYEAYTTDTEKGVLITELQDTQDWLKGSSDESKDVYAAKLAELEQHLDPIEERLKEDEARGFCIDQLLHCINRYRKDATLEDPKFDHIHSLDKDKVIEECKKVEKWLEDKMEQQDQLLRSANPVFHCADIKTNLEALQRFCEHIMLQPRRHVAGGNPNAAAEQKKDQSIMMEEQKAEHNDARVTSIYPIRVIDVEATLKQHDEHGGVVFSRPTSWEFHTISHTWSKGVQCWSNMVDAKLSTSTETSQSTYEGVFMSTDFRSQACYAPFIQFLGLLNADGVKHVWLDALCINQARESGEKAQELQRMGSYYSQSAGCYVCAHGFGEGFKAFTCRSEDPDEPKEVFLPRWFSRVWTFQEFMLPQSLSFVFSLGCRRKFVITQILQHEGKFARKPCSCAASRRPPGSPDIQDDEIEIDPDSLRDYSDTFVTDEEKPDLYKQMNPNLQQAKFPSPCNRCCGSRSIRLARRVVPSDARFNLYFIDRYSFLEVWAHSEGMALNLNIPKGTDIQFKLRRLDSFLDQQDYWMKMDTSNKNIVTVDIDHSNLVIPKDEDGSTQSNRRTGSSGSGLPQHLDPVQVVTEVAMRNCTRDEDRVLSVLGLLGIEGAVQLRSGKPLKDQLLDLAKRMARSTTKRLHTLLVQLCIAEFAGSTTPGMSWAPSMMKRPIKDLNQRDNIELYEAARRAALEIEQHTEVCISQMGQILMYMRKSVEVENVLDDGTLIFAKARVLHDCIFTRQGDVFNLHIVSNSAQDASSSHSTSLNSTAAPLIHDSVTGDMTETFKYICYPFQAHVTLSSYLLINQMINAGPVISSTRVGTMSVVSLPPRQDHYSHLKQFKVHLVLLGQICLPCNTELEVMMICVGDKLGKLHKVGIGWIPGLKSILLKTPLSKCSIGGFEDFIDRFVLL